MDSLKDLAGELRKQASLSIEPLLYARLRRSRRTTLVLLVIVVALGLPVVLIPALRVRARERVQALRAALTAPVPASEPLQQEVGTDPQPYPAEYFKAAKPPEWARLLGTSAPPYRVVPGLEGRPAGTTATGAAEEAPPEATGRQEPGEIVFARGAAEQQAYELVLQSNPLLTSMIGGSDTTLRFKEWAAARMEEGVMLVRVTFVHLPDGSEREYIWRVRLSGREVFPVNFYARSLPKT